MYRLLSVFVVCTECMCPVHNQCQPKVMYAKQVLRPWPSTDMAAKVVCSRISTDNHRHCEQVVWNILHAYRTKACTCSTLSEEIISWSRCTEQLSTCVELAFRLQDNRKSCRCSPRRASARKRPTRAITISLQETPLNWDGAHQDTKRHTPSTWQRTGCCALLLDLLAAFDTIDHSILIERLQKLFGNSGDALTWVVSYLRRRNQQVLIGDTASAEVVIEYGVPQGSVLGPKLYSLYTKPLADVIRHHQLDMHFYADDTQLYVSFENNAPEQQSTAVTRLNTCIGDIRNWLAINMLKLNDDKTEVILFTSKHAFKSHPNVAVTVGEQPVRPATSIHNLGVVYDQPLSMIQHVNSVCRVGYMHVRNIGRIRRYPTEDATKTIVHALVTSRLDYCNAVLYGLPVSVTNKMQRLQNTCARIITKTRRRDHITPMLIKHHWLPVRRRIARFYRLHIEWSTDKPCNTFVTCYRCTNQLVHCGRSRHWHSLYLVQERRRTVTRAGQEYFVLKYICT